MVEENKAIEYVLADGRKVEISFTSTPSGVDLTESFDPETENSEEMQRDGRRTILNNLKIHRESLTIKKE